MKRISVVVLVITVTILGFGGCSARRPIQGQETSGLDRKLSTFAFIEEGELVTFIVGTRAARYRDKSSYMPLEIAIVNTGLRNLVLRRESFTLIDEEGNRYPVATPSELIESYEFLDLDRTAMSELASITTTKFAAFRQYPSKFSPTRNAPASPLQSTTVRDLVSLPKFGYMIDYIYFPKPSTGIKDHQFEVFVESESLPDPVFVKFSVE